MAPIQAYPLDTDWSILDESMHLTQNEERLIWKDMVGGERQGGGTKLAPHMLLLGWKTRMREF